jgi:hypothetical protein
VAEFYQVLGFAIAVVVGYVAVPLAVKAPWYFKPAAVTWHLAFLVAFAVYWPALTP